MRAVVRPAHAQPQAQLLGLPGFQRRRVTTPLASRFASSERHVFQPNRFRSRGLLPNSVTRVAATASGARLLQPKQQDGGGPGLNAEIVAD